MYEGYFCICLLICTFILVSLNDLDIVCSIMKFDCCIILKRFFIRSLMIYINKYVVAFFN